MRTARGPAASRGWSGDRLIYLRKSYVDSRSLIALSTRDARVGSGRLRYLRAELDVGQKRPVVAVVAFDVEAI